MIPGSNYDREAYANTRVHQSFAEYQKAYKALRTANKEYKIAKNNKTFFSGSGEVDQAKKELASAFEKYETAKSKFNGACEDFLKSNKLFKLDKVQILSKGDQTNLHNIESIRDIYRNLKDSSSWW